MQAIQAYEGGVILIFVKDVYHFSILHYSDLSLSNKCYVVKNVLFSLYSYSFSADTEPKLDFAPNLVHHTQLTS